MNTLGKTLLGANRLYSRINYVGVHMKRFGGNKADACEVGDVSGSKGYSILTLLEEERRYCAFLEIAPAGAIKHTVRVGNNAVPATVHVKIFKHPLNAVGIGACYSVGIRKVNGKGKVTASRTGIRGISCRCTGECSNLGLVAMSGCGKSSLFVTPFYKKNALNSVFSTLLGAFSFLPLF